MTRRLDALDVQILSIVQENNQLTAEEMAQKVALSPSAIMRRLRRLREEGVIAAEVAIIAPEEVGNFLSAVVRIQLERHAPAAIEQLLRSLIRAPEVQFCFDVSGSFDVLLLIVAQDMEAFNDFVQKRLAEDPAVRRYESEFVKKRRKASFALNLLLPA